MNLAQLASYRAEIDDYLGQLQKLKALTPAEIFETLAGISARMTEMRTHVYREDSKTAQNLRIREIDPLIDEVDRQFKLWSRVGSMLELEYKLEGRVT